jgi:signal transduction histidine kinase
MRSALRTLANCAVTYLEGRLASKRLAEAQGRLEMACRNRDEFLAMLAHELRAPLAPIHTAVEVLARPEATDAQRTWAQQILRRHVRYMSRIVDDLLSAALVSRGAVALTLEPVRLRDLVDRAVELSEAAVARGVHSLNRRERYALRGCGYHSMPADNRPSVERTRRPTRPMAAVLM